MGKKMKKNTLIIITLMLLLQAAIAHAASIWTTDIDGNLKIDFSPEEIVYVHGSGFANIAFITVDITRPDSVIDHGVTITDSSGNFVYEYLLDGIDGTYLVHANDGINSAEANFTDAASFFINILFPTNNSSPSNPVRVRGIWNVTNTPPGQLRQYNVQIQWGDGNITNKVNINRTEIGSNPNHKFFGTYDTEIISGCNSSDGADNCTMGNFNHNYTSCINITIIAKLYHAQPPGNEAGDGSASVKILNPACQQVSSVCGNRIIEQGEQCDKGSQNGVTCTPPYNGNCTYCSATCQNVTLTDGVCGDNNVDIGFEQCELPNTNNSNYCNQTTEKCSGKKTAIRDAFGNCNSICGCVEDSFSPYQCIVGKCGAECVNGQNESQQCGVSDVGECKFGVQNRTCNGGCSWGEFGECVGAVNPTREICDGKDNDCDGLTDEGFDEDKDGVADCFDKCPDSKPGEEVDQNGCDPFQFCEPFYCGNGCFYADFKGDEPRLKYPKDCTVVLIHKEGINYPKCVPLLCEE